MLLHEPSVLRHGVLHLPAQHDLPRPRLLLTIRQHARTQLLHLLGCRAAGVASAPAPMKMGGESCASTVTARSGVCRDVEGALVCCSLSCSISVSSMCPADSICMLLDSRPAADRGLSSAGDVLGGSGWTLSPGWRPLALSTACAPAGRSSEHARAGNAFRWTTSKHGQPSAVLSSGLIGAGSEAN